MLVLARAMAKKRMSTRKKRATSEFSMPHHDSSAAERWRLIGKPDDVQCSLLHCSEPMERECVDPLPQQ